MALELDTTVVPKDSRQEDLAQIIHAYNQVTDRLQRSHETLQEEVLRLRQELVSTNAQLQRSKRLSALGEMAAGIAHEIRNPLAAIQLYASMVVEDLVGDIQPQVAVENTRKIASAVRGLNAIVSDVLSFARELKPRPCQVNAADLFESVLESHRPAIQAARVEVTCDVDAALSLAVDPDLMRQALLNLVRNAVDAMAEEVAVRRLAMSASETDQGIVLTVADTGPGIDEEAVDRIFNPFFTTRNTGTGLGLAIVHRIVDVHGGSIAVSQAPQGGAVFRLSLPGQCPDTSAVCSASTQGAAA